MEILPGWMKVKLMRSTEWGRDGLSVDNGLSGWVAVVFSVDNFACIYMPYM